MLLTDYDALDLAEKAGGLHLLPENADFYAELVRCSVLVGALRVSDKGMSKISNAAWRRWINSSEPMKGAPEISGDPQEGPFVAEVPCYGGAYLTLPSENPADQFILECLLEALLLRTSVGNSQFTREVVEIALTGLWISDQCIRRAGLIPILI